MFKFYSPFWPFFLFQLLIKILTLIIKKIIDEDLKEFFTNEKTLQIDLNGFEWDSTKNFWRPSKSTGDM